MSLLVLAAPGFGSPADAQTPVRRKLTWPSAPDDPVVRLDGVVKKLANFEVAVQGNATGELQRVDKLKRPAGVDFDERGRLLVTDSRQGVLLRLDLDLGVALVFGTGSTPSLERPLGVAAGPDGTIFVADGGLGRIVAFSPAGDVVATYGEGSLVEPVDVALSADGADLWVVDSKADKVVRFEVRSGAQLSELGARGKGVAEFHHPAAVDLDPRGNLLVVDRVNARVQVFDSSGAFTRALYGAPRSTFSRPGGVTVDASGRVFVTDEAQSQVQVYTSDLEPLFHFGRNGLGDGEFLGVGGIAARGDQLAVVDHAGGRVQTFHLFGVTPSSGPARDAARAVPAAPRAAESSAAESSAVAPETVEPSAAAPAVPPASQERRPKPAPEAAPGPPAEPATSPTSPPAAPAPAPATDFQGRLESFVVEWAAAWSAQDVDRYLDFYADEFLPASGRSHEQWSKLRRERISAPSSIEVGVEAIEVDRIRPDRAEVTFLQSYRSDRFSDRVRKTLVMVRTEGGWKIAAETVLETL